MSHFTHVVVTMLFGQAVFYGMLWVGTVPLGIDNPVGDGVWIMVSIVVAGYTMWHMLRWHDRQDKIERERDRQTN